MNSLLNKTPYGSFLKSGLNGSFDQFQKNMLLSQIDLQLQSVQLGQEERDGNLNLIKQKAYEADIYKTRQARQAVSSFYNYANFQRGLNNLSNQLTQINRNVLETNALNLKQSGVSDMINTNKQLQGLVGNVFAEYAGGDIVAGTGSSADVAKMIEKQGAESGSKAFMNKINQANDQLAKSMQAQYNQNYQNLALESKIYLEGLNVNKQLQD